ncbi:MAG: tetratricopeptide repeat protein, partial [Anaeromyxobacteraceae bacterium]
LGAALLQSGRPQAAEAQLRAALALRPADPEVLFNLGMLLARTGRGEEGRSLLRRYLEVAPSTQVQARRAAEAVLSR